MSHVDYVVTTKLGALRVTPTDANHIYAGSGELTLRGIEYRVNAHLYRWNDGLFHIGREFNTNGERATEYEQRRDVYASRPMSQTDVSNSAKNAMVAVIELAVQAWAPANVDALVAAQRASVEEEIEKREQTIREARAVIATESKAIADLLTTLFPGDKR